MLTASTHPMVSDSGQTPRPHPVDRLVGKSLSHYAVLSRIGGGSQGVVYLARDTRLNRRVALKFLLSQWCQDDAALERFVREAQAGAATMHRNVCTIHGLESTDDGQLFIVMAFYEGQTLKQRLQSGALPAAEAMAVGAQVAEGLAAAHDVGVVHRDIKPGNLMLARDGVKILDFGVARFADSRQFPDGRWPVGTMAYMSPEQVNGDETDARSDVWAAGVVIHEMVTGVVPFQGSHHDAVGDAIRNDPVPIQPLRARGVPRELEAIISCALSKNPRARFQTAAALASSLRCVQQSGATGSWLNSWLMQGRQSWRPVSGRAFFSRAAL